MHRFFVAPEAVQRDTVVLDDRQARQIASVLRLRPGEHIVVLDNSGWQYDTELVEVGPGAARGAISSRSLVDTEAHTKITVYQGLLKGDHFEVVLQKCTELGAAAFVPTICSRCVVGSIGNGRSARHERWERVIVEAAEQSGRGKLPTLQPAAMLAQACEQVRGVSFMAWEGEQSTHLRDALRQDAQTGEEPAQRRSGRARPFSVNLFVGPEGGFAEAEVERAASYGIATVTLGPRILRAETAAIAATALVLYEMGDVG